MAKTQDARHPPSAPLAAILAWMLPGLGHWWIGERSRGVVFFVVMTVTFWGGVAVGGVHTTVAPKGNGAWIAAQLCMGPQALGALYWGVHAVKQAEQRGEPSYRAPWPSSNIAVVYAGVAGLLNLLVIIDVLARVEAAQASVFARSPPKKRVR
ncbi:MAG: hypothetical protein JXQ75_12870 [Phycisphaerae bacterium]|nr:hypothetical protein [Phycisphaerae bacterium]